jgi:hypothetical protein
VIWRPGFLDRPPELPDFLQKGLCPKKIVGDDVGVDDRRH